MKGLTLKIKANNRSLNIDMGLSLEALKLSGYYFTASGIAEG